MEISQRKGQVAVHNQTGTGCNPDQVPSNDQVLPQMPMHWRVILICMGLFFFMATCVQYNDPDPCFWMFAYAIPCGLSLIMSYNKVNFDWRANDNTKDEIHIKSAGSVVTVNEGRPTTSTFVTSNNSNSRCNVITRLFNFNTLIIIHVIYCFALGIWTLTLFFNGITTQRETITKFRQKHGFLGESEELVQVEMNAEEAKEIFGLCLAIAWLALLRDYQFLRLGKLGLALGTMLTAIPFIAWILIEIYESRMENVCY